MKSLITFALFGSCTVAPVRERGLKFASVSAAIFNSCRSREGAWIEMCLAGATKRLILSRSREGAWIEIFAAVSMVISIVGRSREGAWIEISHGIIYTESEVRSLP